LTSRARAFILDNQELNPTAGQHDMAGQNKAIETDFPFAELSRVAEAESWRKELNRPLAHIHKW
jgi:hypothetical protein